ncbi:E3 ubiquitin-protein ligase TRIP12 [Patella vulgata]|uniref:E3 ubiquitin-protein ligase TRIP12 n=1 Tax=Patella vulgata TaxID=6465 RepID=UPI0024A9BE9A|nr:E3 ubiquitin-protein ligase TRIP12 [Patella vulgata]XP_050411437.2 E3 ubiquitin-protein ligase TRIP12 [Patella vulgata]XP_050411438.2 E3 ubiquitin-protein ligase TRIP12 [Patella vulgata]
MANRGELPTGVSGRRKSRQSGSDVTNQSTNILEVPCETNTESKISSRKCVDDTRKPSKRSATHEIESEPSKKSSKPHLMDIHIKSSKGKNSVKSDQPTKSALELELESESSSDCITKNLRSKKQISSKDKPKSSAHKGKLKQNSLKTELFGSSTVKALSKQLVCTAERLDDPVDKLENPQTADKRRCLRSSVTDTSHPTSSQSKIGSSASVPKARSTSKGKQPKRNRQEGHTSTNSGEFFNVDKKKSRSGGMSASKEGSNSASSDQPSNERPQGAAARPVDDADETDMGRLQALLEARGLPSQLFGALGPRMHQFLHRTMSGGTMSKVQQLLQGLQATGDEGQQLTAVMEMCQLLVMGNEDSLAGFPVKQVVPALISLLHLEHNFDIMNHACRALTYMMEALPRSSAVVVDAIPVFLEKLQVIQCMDVAEQALTALEMISRRHSKAVLQAGGIAACLMFIDFFSITAQRSALAVVANCLQSLTCDEFHFLRDSLPLLSSRLNHQDKKSVESVCSGFSRVVENFQSDQRLLKEIAVHGLLTNLQQLLVASPPIINSATFVMVIRMMAVMCGSCPDLAVILLKQNIADTLCHLLVGTPEDPLLQVELVSRTPQELYEIVCLIGELLPKLPSDGIFRIDTLLGRNAGFSADAIAWQWQDDRNIWHSYTPIDSRIIEDAYSAAEDEISLTTVGRTYTVDFKSMQQINEDSGTARPVQRKINASAQPQHGSDCSLDWCDSREEFLKEDHQLASSFIQSLFSVLYEVYSSSPGPTVRHKCLQTILRMVYYASATLLKDVLLSQPVSSHIAAMMASPDLKVVVGALQLAEILMQKLPDIFSVYFRREGVMHQIKRLAELKVHTSKSSSEKVSSGVSGSLTSGGASASKHSKSGVREKESTDSAATSHTSSEEPGATSSHMFFRLGDVLKRKHTPKRARKGSKPDDPMESGSKGVPTSGGRSSRRGKHSDNSDSKVSGATPKMSFLPSLRSWSRLSNSSHCERMSVSKESEAQKFVRCADTNKEKIRSWVKEEATKFLEKNTTSEAWSNSHPAVQILQKLCDASQGLTIDSDNGLDPLLQIATITKESDISPFEIIHSGMVKKLLQYLTSVNGTLSRTVRIQRFLHVFLSCPPPDITYIKEMAIDPNNPPPLSNLISKLLGCLHQLEQFQIRVHDLPGSGGMSGRGSNALKFFSTHQLKCNLQRHPSATNLRQWKGGPVKIDPLALVQAIERYLVIRGIGKVKDGEEEISDDGNSDEDFEDTMSAVCITQGTVQHKLEFLIGEKLLPYDMTVYEAIKQFSHPSERESDSETETPLGHAKIWAQTHTIWYRAYCDKEDVPTEGMRKKIENKSKSSKKTDDAHKTKVDSSRNRTRSLLDTFLTEHLPSYITIEDTSLEVISLLRVTHALNKYWAAFYEISFFPTPILTASEFISNKLTAKANRQLQDPLVIMTGNLPKWLGELGTYAPFLFPFETRQLLFFITTFDRDRAMMKLQQDSGGDNSQNDSERVAPRLDRKRRMVNRNDLLKQAEQIIDELDKSKALLEIQYENEVGTGLGPTQEFYALVSRELQRADLDLWRGDVLDTTSHSDPDAKIQLMHSPFGLFPSPLPKSVKASYLKKVSSKCKFLGKFLARSLMDSRMLDIRFSQVFYKWCLGQEESLTSADLIHIDPVLARSHRQLEAVLHQKKQILTDKSHTDESRQLALDSLTMDGCSIEDLNLYFILPGFSQIELKKGGRECPVVLDNLEEYLQLLVQWNFMDGVSRQFQAFREGFESLVPLSSLRCFYPEELEQLFCGNHNEVWDVKMLMDCCRPDHGYSQDSQAVKYLFEILSQYNSKEQRDFIQFVTGSPCLPVGGFRSLNPPLTIVRKTFESTESPDNYLPSVMTCVNYLKLPDYSTIDIMRQKIGLAAQEGQLSFHLS